MLYGQITHSYQENTCTLVIPHPHAREKPFHSPTPAEAAAPAEAEAAETEPGRGVLVVLPQGGEGCGSEELHVDRIRNCDIFIDSHDLYFFADVKLYKFHSRRTFDLRELKTLLIKFNPEDNHYQLCLRCLPPATAATTRDGSSGGGGGRGGASSSIGDAPKPKNVRKEYIATFLRLPTMADAMYLPDKEPLVQEWKLKRITDQCQLQLEGRERIYKLTNNFGYGYASKYSGPPEISDVDKSTCRVLEPHRLSPIQRRQDRVVDEMKRFSRDQYKMNFVELQVPSGHQNPLRFKPKIFETSMTQEQARLLHNLSREALQKQQKDEDPADQDSPLERLRQKEIDCGLISIMLAICYDVRTTNNDPTCESAWTRSILCPLFCYYEQFDNYRDVLVAFLRRAITYPLFRNFELGRQCVRDAIEVLKGGRNWLINQLLLTHQQFASGEPCRESFNTHYLEDYIRYVTNPNVCSDEHLRLLARNVKNVLMDVTKKHLNLGVTEIETELIQELMQEMRLTAGGESPSLQQGQSGDDDMDLDNDTSGQEDETTTDDDSVITDSFDSMDMDMRLIENEAVYVPDDDNDDDEDDEDDDEDDEDDDDDDEEGGVDDDNEDTASSTTTSSEAEGNSVIEQCSNSETAASNSISTTSTK
ncbi:protein SHQ1 homolog isoform X1 [Drosophila guanche]|uniref:Protein SHQ1 homolog n=1 Tax=Drosophila guanche TaxID=7266 RepID=A0A3B0K7U8_DROGU|nr:protein SHQ1 homolog isoform X1 [Drosophila guanche]SPP84150.1 blast:Protein SHQ1 homolog [Drosophila guanche]